MSDQDSGRVSAVCDVALPEGRFDAMCRALKAAQSHAAGLRSVSYGQRGSGGLREVTADERAIDAGVVTRGRRALERVGRTDPRARAALAWLRDYAHCGDLRSLGALYGEHQAPADLSGAVIEAEMRLSLAARALRSAEAEFAHVAPKRTQRPTPQAVALRVLVVARTEQRDGAQGRLDAATAERTAWGVAALVAACRAWDAVDVGEARAA